MASIASRVWTIGTTPFRWAYNTASWAGQQAGLAGQRIYQAGNDHILNPVKNIFKRATATMQKNTWYTPAPAISQAIEPLKRLRAGLAEGRTIPTDAQRDRLRDLSLNAIASLNGMIMEVFTRNDFYGTTPQQVTELRALRDYIVEIHAFLQANPLTPCQIPIANPRPGVDNGRSDFLKLFSSALEFADKWGQPHGPVTALKKGVVKPITKRINYRPSAEMRTCVRLADALTQLPAATPAAEARPIVVQLVSIIDQVILQRCGPHGAGSYEIRELAPLLLLQANLEDLLEQPLAPNFIQLVQPMLQAPAAANFITQYGQKGYRPRLTQHEADPLVLTTRQNLHQFHQNSAQFLAQNQSLPLNMQNQIQPLQEKIGTVLAHYPQLEGERRAILQDGESALAEIFAHGGILSAEQQERLSAALECLEKLSSVERGWLRRQAGKLSSVSFAPTYTPPVQIVSAYSSLRRMEQIVKNRQIPRPLLIESARGAAGDLRTLLTWLKEPAQAGLYTPYFRRQLKNLVVHLENGHNLSNRSLKKLVQQGADTPFTRVQPRLDFWSRKAKLGHKTLPAIETSSRQAVLRLKNITAAFHKALLSKERISAPFTQRLLKTIAGLEQEITWGLIEVDPILHELLTQNSQNFQAAIQETPDWFIQQDSREVIARRFQALESSITDLVHSTTYTASNDRGLPWAAFDAPFLPEFQELHLRLDQLDHAIEERSPDAILMYTRNTWAFTQALLEQENGRSDALIAKYQLKPEMLQSLQELNTLLGLAIQQKVHGSCDPENLHNFHFQRQPVDQGSGAVVIYSPYDAVQQMRCSLDHWKLFSKDALEGGPSLLKGPLKRALIGKKLPTVSIPQAPEVLLNRANELMWETLDIREKKLGAAAAIPYLQKQIQENPTSAASLGELLTPLQNFVRLSPTDSFTDTDREHVRDSIVKIRAMHRKDQMQLAITNVQKARDAIPLNERGLTGKALGATASALTGAASFLPIRRAANYLMGPGKFDLPADSPTRSRVDSGLAYITPDPETVQLAAEEVALTVDDGINDWMYRLPSPPTGPTEPSGPGGGSGGPATGAPPQGTAPQSTAPQSQPNGPPRRGTLAQLGALLDGALRFFDQVKQGDLGAAATTLCVSGLPKAAISFGAKKIADGLERYINTLDENEDKETITELKSLQAAIRGAGQQQTTEQANVAIKKAMKALGFDPNDPTTDPDHPYFFDLQAQCKEALQFNKRSAPIEQPIQKLVDEQKKLFVENNSYFAPMKVLYEWVCGCKIKDLDFYAKLIRKARAAGPEQEASVLKESFMQELEKAEVNLLTRTLVRFVFFPILHHLSKRYLEIFANRGLEWIREFINQNNKDTETSLPNRTVERTNGFLDTVQSAYRKIAKNGIPSGSTLKQELDRELSQPTANDGLTQAELHQKTADKLIDTFIAPDFAQWSRGIRNVLGSIHVGKKDSLGDAIVHSTLVVVSWALSLIVYPVEWITRKATLAIAKRYVINGQVVGTLMDSSVQSIERNGYTHALNCVLHDQLCDILELLQDHYGIIKKKPLRPGQKKEDPIDLKNVSHVNKETLRTFVRQIFGILEKHNCGSKEDLQKVMDKSALGNLKDTIEDRVLYSKVTESVEEVLGAAIHTILKKDQLENQFFQLTKTINGIYESDKQIDPKEFQTKENDINKLVDTILSLVISKSIDEQVDSDKSFEQRSTNRYIQEIEKITKSLDKLLHSHLARLNAKKHHGVLPVNTGVQTLLGEMLEKSYVAINQLIDLRARIKTASELSTGKTHLFKTLANLHKKLDAIITPLTALHNPHAHKLLGEKMEQTVQRFNKHLSLIQEALRDPIPSDLIRAKKSLNLLKVLIERFNQEPALAEVSLALEKERQQLRKNLKKLEGSVLIEHELSHTLDTSVESSPLFKWYSTIGTLAASTPAAKSAYAEVEQSLKSLSSLPEHAEKLRAHIDAVKSGSSPAERKKAFEKLKKTCQDMLHTTATTAKQSQKKMASIKLRCKKELAKARFTKDIPPADAFKEVTTGIRHFEQWIKDKESRAIHLKNTGLLNQVPGYLPARDYIIGKGKNFVYNRVRGKVDGLLGLIRDPVLWRHGVFTTNILRPFVATN